jgi:hypothetical protein
MAWHGGCCERKERQPKEGCIEGEEMRRWEISM